MTGTLAPEVAILLTLHRGPLLHAALAYPEGRLSGRTAAVVVALAWLDGAVPALAASPEATLALAALVGAVALHGAARARGPMRPARRVGAAVTCALVAVPAVGALLDLKGAGGWDAVLAVHDLSVVAAGLLLARPARPRAIAALVVELGGSRAGGTLRRALGGALGDPGLAVAYGDADGGLVDDAGRPV